MYWPVKSDGFEELMSGVGGGNNIVEMRRYYISPPIPISADTED